MCKNTTDDCNPEKKMENNEKIKKDSKKMGYEDKMKKISGYIEEIKSGLNNLAIPKGLEKENEGKYEIK